MALGAPGCILEIDGSDFSEDDDRHGSQRSRVSHCERERYHCLVEAGSNARFQQSCREAYRSCMGRDSDSSRPSEPDECEGSDSDSDSSDDCPDSKSPQPQYPKDTVWDDRCKSIEAACKSACKNPAERERCEQWGQQCKNTRCGTQKRCSEQPVEAQFSQCGLGHLGCVEGAGNDEERALCSGSFRLCAKAVPGFESLGQTSDGVLSICLDQQARCRRFAKTPELQQNCATMLRACLKPW